MFSLIFVSVVVVISVFVYSKLNQDSRYHKFAGPKGLPLIGYSWAFIGKSQVEIIRLLSTLHKQYGPNLRIPLEFFTSKLMLSDPHDIEAVLTHQKLITKNSDYDFVRNWLVDGLLTSSGDKWHAMRKIITPTFHFKILERFCDVFDRQSTILVDCLEKYVDGDSFDVLGYITNCALDIICETSMGIKVNAQTDSSSVYVRTVHDLKQIFLLRMFDPTIKYDFIYKLTKMYKNEMKLTGILHDFTDNVIKSRRAEILQKPEKLEENLDEDLGIKKRIAFLDLILQSTINGQPLTDLEIREEVDTFMFAGHDTVTSAISFVLHNLAKYPEIQEKCYQEVQNMIGSGSDYKMNQRDLNNLQYLELVIKESLRLYPSVPFIGRRVIEDTEINGKLLAKDSDILIPILFMGRNPKIFEDPLSFRPERFEGADISNHFSYIPFSAGFRNCMGQKFAMLEMKCTVSKILRYYELSLDENEKEFELMVDLVLRTVNGIKLKIKKRKSA